MKITLSGDDAVLKYSEYLASLPAKLEEANERALDMAAAAILNRLRTTFRSEKDPEGNAWVPSRAGLKHKAQGTGQTMFDSGRLFHSIQLAHSSMGERIIGTDVPYAEHHQGPSAIVERKFLELTDEHIDMAVKIFENQLMKAFK